MAVMKVREDLKSEVMKMLGDSDKPISREKFSKVLGVSNSYINAIIHHLRMGGIEIYTDIHDGYILASKLLVDL